MNKLFIISLMITLTTNTFAQEQKQKEITIDFTALIESDSVSEIWITPLPVDTNFHNRLGINSLHYVVYKNTINGIDYADQKNLRQTWFFSPYITHVEITYNNQKNTFDLDSQNIFQIYKIQGTYEVLKICRLSELIIVGTFAKEFYDRPGFYLITEKPNSIKPNMYNL